MTTTTPSRRPIKRASAKAAGRTWENRCAEYLRPLFPHVERRRQAGRFDRGDLINAGPWSVECKNQREISLSSFLDETVRQQATVGADWHVLLINRKNHSIDDAYAVMTFRQLRELMEAVG